MNIYICVYRRRGPSPSYSLPDKVTLSEIEAREWKDKVLSHHGADLRFWIPYVYITEFEENESDWEIVNRRILDSIINNLFDFLDGDELESFVNHTIYGKLPFGLTGEI